MFSKRTIIDRQWNYKRIIHRELVKIRLMEDEERDDKKKRKKKEKNTHTHTHDILYWACQKYHDVSKNDVAIIKYYFSGKSPRVKSESHCRKLQRTKKPYRSSTPARPLVRGFLITVEKKKFIRYNLEGYYLINERNNSYIGILLSSLRREKIQ